MFEIDGVRGFLSGADCQWLYRQGLSQPNYAKCVEVGSMFGLSAFQFVAGLRDACSSGSILYCVDTWLGSHEHQQMPEIQGGSAYAIFAANMARLDLWPWIVPVQEASPAAAERFEAGSLDWVFIDGAHDAESVRADCEAWWQLVRPGGTLCGHDAVPCCEVFPAVQDFAASIGIPAVFIPGTQGIWVIRKEEAA